MTIAIIDKYPIARSGIQLVLNEHFGANRILESDGITSFYQQFKNEIPDLIILSVNQERGISNLETLRFLKEFYSISRTILYDDYAEPIALHRYFKFGIAGYISKMDGLTELITCVQEIIKGRSYLKSEMHYALIRDASVYGSRSLTKSEIYLTNREYEIATHLINGGKTSEIARNLKRKASTISTIKANIFKKMKVNNVVKLKCLMDH